MLLTLYVTIFCIIYSIHYSLLDFENFNIGEDTLIGPTGDTSFQYMTTDDMKNLPDDAVSPMKVYNLILQKSIKFYKVCVKSKYIYIGFNQIYYVGTTFCARQMDLQL